MNAVGVTCAAEALLQNPAVLDIAHTESSFMAYDVRSEELEDVQ